MVLSSHSCSDIPLEIIVWISDTFENYLKIKYDFTKYLKEYPRRITLWFNIRGAASGGIHLCVHVQDCSRGHIESISENRS